MSKEFVKRLNIVLGPVALLFLLAGGANAGYGDNCFRVGTHPPKVDRLFINQFRAAQLFTPSRENVPCDEQGYPLSVPFVDAITGDSISRITYIMRNVPMKNPLEDSIYILRWDGDGEFDLGNQLSDSGYMEYNISQHLGEVDKLVLLKLRRSNEHNPVRNVRFYLKHYERMYEEEGKVFMPEVLALMEPFKILRFMHLFHTNNSKFRSWVDHTPKDFQDQMRGPTRCGMSYEWAVELCNLTGKHMWFNVPHQADDYSIRKMAQIIRDNLDPNLDVFLEYSNETWNGGREYKDQFEYVIARGGWVTGHVELSKNVFGIWHDEFGDQRHRVKRVIADYGFAGIRRLQECGPENFDVYSTRYYWGGGKNTKDFWDENTTVDQMLNDIRENLRTNWYLDKKSHADEAKLYGLEAYCYEGGLGGDPEAVRAYPYWKGFQKLQKDPRLLPLIAELVDTLASLGFKGGNELSMFGGWEDFVPKNDGSKVSFWGMLRAPYSDPDEYPKYAGMRDAALKYDDCDDLDRESDTVGSGMALLFDGLNDRVNLSSAWKPSSGPEQYSIEFWVNPSLSAHEQTLLYVGNETGTSFNRVFLSSTDRISWVVRNADGSTIVSPAGPVLTPGRYYHISAVRSADRYRLYVNGTEKVSVPAASGTDENRVLFLVGAGRSGGSDAHHFRGRMDELRLWNTALSGETIRTWMCRKAAFVHPEYANLKHAYKFDLINGTSAVDLVGAADGILQNFDFSLYSHYVKSGAPIGDDSRYIYPSDWANVAQSIPHPNGDRLTVSNLGIGTPEGLHLYRVDHAPNDKTMPTADYTRMSDHYYGVFAVNGNNAEYAVRYRYDGNPAADDGAGNRLLRRRDNTIDSEWKSTGAELDIIGKTLTIRPGYEKDRNEYVLGIREVVSTTTRGPGYALRLRDSSQIRGIPFYRPNHEYTVSMWFRGSGSLFRFTDYSEASAARNTEVNSFAGKGIGFSISGSPGVSDNGNYLLDIEQWNHVAFVKKDNHVSLYLNGILHPSIRNVNLGRNEDGSLKDVEYVKVLIGERFNGLIDELRVWSTALPQERIREWMCRSITDKHPEQENSLVAYFTFDEGKGSSVSNRRGSDEFEIVGDYSWEFSGAPIGDTSTYRYAVGTLSLEGRGGDRITVVGDTAFSEEYAGHHLYRVDRAPLNSTFPSEARVVDTTHYWGVWVVPNSKFGSLKPYRYSLRYSFKDYGGIADAESVRLLTRTDNSENRWKLQTTSPDLSINSLSLTTETVEGCNSGNGYCAAPRELLLAATQNEALSPDVSSPERPGEISGKTLVCAGQENLVYRVSSVQKADKYLWTIPEGMVGYSDADTIIVSIARNARGELGTISVRAVNQYGESRESTKQITAQGIPTGVTIEGPAEICWGATAVSYSISSVSGITEYIWEATNGSTISGEGTKAKLTAGGMNTVLTVYGTTSCGKVALATRTVVVNKSPDLGLPVEGGRVCSGCDGCSEYARVTVYGSETGIVYQAYKRNGTAPVGEAVPGNGSEAVLFLPVSELLVGENLISVKAGAGSCPAREMEQRASVIVDITPASDMEITFHRKPQCPGDSVVFLVKGAPPGTMFKVFGDYEMAVWWPFNPWDLEEPTMATGGETHIVVPPAPGFSQSSGEGIALGPNKIWFTAQIGSCPTVRMDSEFSFSVDRGNIRFVYANPHDDWYLREYDPEVWDSAHSIWTDISTRDLCARDPISYTIYNAQKGVGYVACEVEFQSGMQAYPIRLLSDTVYCDREGDTIDLFIPGGSFEPGSDEREISAVALGEGIGSSCNIIIAAHERFMVHPSPDTTLSVSDGTVCRDGDAFIELENGEKGITYRARIVDSDYISGRRNGSGERIVFRIPGNEFAMGPNRVVIEAENEFCSQVILVDTATVTRVDRLNRDLKAAGNYKDLCIGVAAEITVYNPEPGVTYEAYHESKMMSDSYVGVGDSIVLVVPGEKLKKLVDSDFVIKVHARAGDCVEELKNAVAFHLKDVEYPEGGILVHNKAGTTLCPEDEYIWVSEQNYDDGTPYPVHIQGTVNGNLVGERVLVDTVDQNIREPNIAIRFPRNELPEGDTVTLGFAAIIDGCPPKKLDFRCWNWNCNFDSESQPSWIADDYDLTLQVLPDTICSGGNGVVEVVHPQGDGVGGFEYRLYDAVNDVEVCPEKGTQWGTLHNENKLPLNPFDPSILKPGVNRFDVQVRHTGGGGCGWTSLDNKAVIFVRSPPERDLPVTGNSVCAGDGTVAVERTQPCVRYQAFVGNTGVSEEKDGTGGALTFVIPSKWLNRGSNEITVRATTAGCGTVVLEQSAIVQVIDHAPGKPATPTGPTEVCANATQVRYSVPFDNDALSYTWDLPVGASTNSTTNVALIDFGTLGGEIRVTANSACGSSPASDPLIVNTTSSGAGGIIAGPSNAECEGTVELTLSGHDGRIVNWQWSLNSTEWNDILVTSSTIPAPVGRSDRTYRAVVDNGACGRVVSKSHTVKVDPCSVSPLQTPIPDPEGGTKTQKQFTVNFQPSYQDDVRDVYYALCSDPDECSLEDAVRYDPIYGISVDFSGDGYRRMIYQARPKPGHEDSYLPSPVDTVSYFYALNQLGVPVARPQGRVFKEKTVTVHFETPDQSAYREIRYRICADTVDCGLTEENRSIYDPNDGIVLDLSEGQKGLVFQAVPLPAYENKYSAGKVGRELYRYLPGIAVSEACYKDRNADGEIDYAEITFDSAFTELPQLISLRAPHDETQRVTRAPARIDDRTVFVDFSDEPFTPVMTGFEAGPYGEIRDSSETFNHTPFAVHDSVAPVLISASYRVANETNRGNYYDTLIVKFSEPLMQEGAAPFMYHNFGDRPKLQDIRIQGAILRAIVVVPSDNQGEAVPPGALISINTDESENSVRDLHHNYQRNPANRKVPVVVKTGRRPVEKHYGPTLFNPSEREFVFILRAHTRVGKLSGDSEGRARILDRTGNVVCTKKLELDIDALTMRWDGRNDNGRYVGQGTYILIAEYSVNGTSGTERVKIGVKR